MRAGRHLFADLDHPDGVVGPPAQRVDDRAPGGELRVTRDELLARLGEQALQGVEAARVVEAGRRLLGELGVAIGASSCPGVPGGGLHLTVLGAPFGGPGGKELRRLRLGPVELCLEHLAKRLMETVGALVERNEERGCPRQPFQPLGGSAGLERPVAEAGRQALEDGGALEKAHVLLLEPGQALLAEVVVDVPVGPAERAQVLPLDLVGERGQVQPRRPALEARGQGGDHLVGGVHAGAT